MGREMRRNGNRSERSLPPGSSSNQRHVTGNRRISLVAADIRPHLLPVEGISGPGEIVPAIPAARFRVRAALSGSGLGLVITRRNSWNCTRANVEVESEPGQGSTFTAVFPRRLPGDDELKKRILVVDTISST